MYLKISVPAFVVAAFAAALCSGVTSAAELKTEEEKAFYYLGTVLSNNLKVFDLSDSEVDAVLAGMKDQLAGEAEEMDDEAYRQMLNDISQQRLAANAAREAGLAQAYVDTMAAEQGAITADSGLVYLAIVTGDGDQATRTSTVTAHYRGTLRDGTVFDSSFERGEPLTIPLTRVIPCWSEGIAMMRVGGKSKLTCPPDIAYGDQASGPIPPGSALTFEVELLGIVE